jgi:hypothetical protein
MDLKRLITHFTYRIEPRPEGGFIAHATDPTVPPLEASTREELQQKIQANIAASLASEFPGLKLPLKNEELKFAFHIEHKPASGFTIYSADPDAQPIEGASHVEIESHFVEKLIGFVGKHLMPELLPTLAAQGSSGDIKVFVNRKGFTTKTGSHTLSFGRDLELTGSIQPNDVTLEDAKPRDTTMGNANLTGVGDSISNSAIIPETSSSWPIFRFLLALLIITALMYFFLRYR